MHAGGNGPVEKGATERLEMEERMKAGVLEKRRDDVWSISRSVHIGWGRDTLTIVTGGKKETRGLNYRSGREWRVPTLQRSVT